jgi:prolipoprotein diacylglyceryltransferase
MTPLDIDDFLLWATVGIVAGGRIGYILFYDFAAVAANPDAGALKSGMAACPFMAACWAPWSP